MEALYAVQADLEALAGKLLNSAGEGSEPDEGAGLQELVTEAAVALVEFKGLAREGFMAVEECRCVASRGTGTGTPRQQQRILSVSYHHKASD